MAKSLNFPHGALVSIGRRLNGSYGNCPQNISFSSVMASHRGEASACWLGVPKSISVTRTYISRSFTTTERLV